MPGRVFPGIAGNLICSSDLFALFGYGYHSRSPLSRNLIRSNSLSTQFIPGAFSNYAVSLKVDGFLKCDDGKLSGCTKITIN